MKYVISLIKIIKFIIGFACSFVMMFWSWPALFLTGVLAASIFSFMIAARNFFSIKDSYMEENETSSYKAKMKKRRLEFILAGATGAISFVPWYYVFKLLSASLEKGEYPVRGGNVTLALLTTGATTLYLVVDTMAKKKTIFGKISSLFK